jgi:hypothetical protein
LISTLLTGQSPISVVNASLRIAGCSSCGLASYAITESFPRGEQTDRERKWLGLPHFVVRSRQAADCPSADGQFRDRALQRGAQAARRRPRSRDEPLSQNARAMASPKPDVAPATRTIMISVLSSVFSEGRARHFHGPPKTAFRRDSAL